MTPGSVTVLGLDFAGSLAAYRLAEAGWRVTIIDPHARTRQTRPGADEAGPRATPGIAQSGHLHVLLGRGLRILQGVYPDLAGFLDDSRCPTLDWAADTVWRTPFGLAPSYDSGIRTRSLRRTHLDSFMLGKVVGHPLYFAIPRHCRERNSSQSSRGTVSAPNANGSSPRSSRLRTSPKWRTGVSVEAPSGFVTESTSCHRTANSARGM